MVVTDELEMADWFTVPEYSRWSNEIGLCPFFDMLNHTQEPNADWDFDSHNGAVWVRASDDAMVSFDYQIALTFLTLLINSQLGRKRKFYRRLPSVVT